MFRKRKLIKVVAIFFSLQIIFDAVYPTLTYALTSGPTAPEATSFEPVDTTDMVNLATGDFVYNIPLLEVPGPSGGYPLSLSYHAGIQPNEEASWVGLGWTLNPGAITREVSGYVDDYKDVLVTDRFFWEGGETHTVEIGANMGIAGFGGVTAGLSFSKDTYQGFGIGSFIGANMNVGESASVGVKMGASPFGGAYMSAGLNVGIAESENGAISLSTSLGVSTNFESVSGYASGGLSVSMGEQSREGMYLDKGAANLLGASLSTRNQGISGQVSAGNVNISQNRKSGKLSTSSWGITLPIPYVHLGYKYQRYWIDETDLTYSNGVLYYPSESQDLPYFDDHAFDNYSLLDPRVEGGILKQPDPNKVLGGTFPDFDHFSVTAQGLGGNMKPF